MGVYNFFFPKKNTKYVQDQLDWANMRNGAIVSVIAGIMEAFMILFTTFYDGFSDITTKDNRISHYHIGYWILLTISIFFIISFLIYRKMEGNDRVRHLVALVAVHTMSITYLGFGIYISNMDSKSGVEALVFVTMALVAFGLFSYYKPFFLTYLIGSFLIFALTNRKFGMGDYINLAVFFIMTYTVSHLNFTKIIRMAHMEEQLLQVSYHDSITGILNRRALTRDMHALAGKRINALLTDVDNFKQYNDTYGHDMGDEVLRAFANTLVDAFGEEHVYRFGGDEFIVVVPGDELAFTKKIERLRGTSVKAESRGIKVANVTFSGGYISGVVTTQKEMLDFINAADDTLYNAKENSRGKIVRYRGANIGLDESTAK